jgi:hypothetical protein
MAGPESAVLPLHHIPIVCFCFAGAKLVLFSNNTKDFETFFIKKIKFKLKKNVFQINRCNFVPKE